MWHPAKGLGKIQESEFELFHVVNALGKILDDTSKLRDAKSLFTESMLVIRDFVMVFETSFKLPLVYLYDLYVSLSLESTLNWTIGFLFSFLLF